MSSTMQIRVFNLLEKDINSSSSNKQPTSLKLFYGNQKNFQDDLSMFYEFLSDKEIARSKRFFHLRDERTYVISHALVNRKICELLQINFHQISINYFDNKKPYVEQSNIDFNLSHSYDYFAFAIGNNKDIFIGVDIEVVRENLDIEPIVNHYFHKNEISYILNSDLKTQHQKFYEVWTRKEAFLKMLGTGLSEKLSELDMTPGEREIIIQDNNSLNNHYFSNTYVYPLNLRGKLVLSLSTNRPVNIIPECCEKF